MALLVIPADFKEPGFHHLANSNEILDEIQEFIDDNEAKYIRQILGVELGNLFIADLSAPTQEARFAAIEDAFTEQESDGTIQESEGIKKALMGLIYFYYVHENQARHSTTGFTLSQSETMNVLSPTAAAREGQKRWNKALDTIEAIQWYCSEFLPADYPEFKGIVIHPQSMF